MVHGPQGVLRCGCAATAVFTAVVLLSGSFVAATHHDCHHDDQRCAICLFAGSPGLLTARAREEQEKYGPTPAALWALDLLKRYPDTRGATTGVERGVPTKVGMTPSSALPGITTGFTVDIGVAKPAGKDEQITQIGLLQQIRDRLPMAATAQVPQDMN